MYTILLPESLAVLLATNRQLRSSVHSLATSMTLTSVLDVELLARRSWPQLVKLKLTGIKDSSGTERLCSILAAGLLTSLQYLDVSYVPLTAEAMQKLAQGRWPALTSLDLSGSLHSTRWSSKPRVCYGCLQAFVGWQVAKTGSHQAC